MIITYLPVREGYNSEPIWVARSERKDGPALKAAGFGDEFIVNKIKSSPAAFNVDVADLVKLKQSGLSELVIGAMIEAAH